MTIVALRRAAALAVVGVPVSVASVLMLRAFDLQPTSDDLLLVRFAAGLAVFTCLGGIAGIVMLPSTRMTTTPVFVATGLSFTLVAFLSLIPMRAVMPERGFGEACVWLLAIPAAAATASRLGLSHSALGTAGAGQLSHASHASAASPQRLVLLGAMLGGALGTFSLLFIVFFGSLLNDQIGMPPSTSGVPPSSLAKLMVALDNALCVTIMLGLHYALAAAVAGVVVGVSAGLIWGHWPRRQS